MSKVILNRDLPDDVLEALTKVVKANARVVRRTQGEVRGQVDRETILEILRGGRGD